LLQLAGLLTFLSLLYLPGKLPVALYKQTALTRITAAGTVRDSHPVPLHRGRPLGLSFQFAGAKLSNKNKKEEEKARNLFDNRLFS